MQRFYKRADIYYAIKQHREQMFLSRKLTFIQNLLRRTLNKTWNIYMLHIPLPNEARRGMYAI